MKYIPAPPPTADLSYHLQKTRTVQ